MRLSQSTGRRRVVTCLLTLSLLAFGVPGQGQLRLEASHEEAEKRGFILLGVAIAAAVAATYFTIRAIKGRNKPDPPDPNTTSQTTRKTDRWRPLPPWLQSVADREFGTTTRIRTAGPRGGRQLNLNLSAVHSP